MKLTEIPMQESIPPEAQEISVKKHEGKAIMVKGRYYIGSAEGHEYPDLQVGDEVNPRPFFVLT